MSKKKHKKRNKPYTGVDAVPDKPTVKRYTAVVRSPLGEWWQARKRVVKIASIVAAVVIFITWIIIEFVQRLAS